MRTKVLQSRATRWRLRQVADPHSSGGSLPVAPRGTFSAQHTVSSARVVPIRELAALVAAVRQLERRADECWSIPCPPDCTAQRPCHMCEDQAELDDLYARASRIVVRCQPCK